MSSSRATNSNAFFIAAKSRFFICGIFAAGAALLTGCATTQPVSGLLYGDVAGPVAISSTPLGPKHGTGCASSILGLIATGDASITTAAKSAGIGQVSHVEQHSTSIWFLYNKYCIDVWGWAARGGTPATTPGSQPPPPSVPPPKPPGASLTPVETGIQTADNHD